MGEIGVKECWKCLEIKDFAFFSKNRAQKDGLSGACKDCKKTMDKEYRIKNEEKIRQYKKDWGIKKEEELKEKRKIYWQKNRDRQLERRRQDYQKNKSKYTERAKLYVEKNREKTNKNKRKWSKNKEDTNPVYKLAKNLRSIISKAFIRKKWKKNGKTQEMIGCDYETAFEHLKNTFKQNYGLPLEEARQELHIDHIIPLASAKTKEELIKLNHYTNLQYLYASDNLKKNDKLNWELSHETL